MQTSIRPTAILAGILFLSSTAAFAADPAINCEASKLKEAGKYGNCRLKAESKGVKKNEAPDYTKCEEKFAEKWGKAETKAGPTVCPSEGDQLSMDARITTDTAEIATLLAGGEVAECGNGVVDAGEQCDGGSSTPTGFDCAGFGLFGEDRAFCGYDCQVDTSLCSATRYEDTGLGTVIDHQTGLEWTKTDDLGGLTDKDNTYTWSDNADGDITDRDGTAFTVFIGVLNNQMWEFDNVLRDPPTGCYADRCDWRLPTFSEIWAIVENGSINPIFGPLIAEDFAFYLTSTTELTNPNQIWIAPFEGNGPFLVGKGSARPVRAVRTAD